MRAVGGVVRPLSVVRQDEIVIVRAIPGPSVGSLPNSMRVAQRELADEEIPLGIGISTVHKGVAGLPTAYREARDAAERVDPATRCCR